MTCCVILHNMIIESERKYPVDEKQKVSYFSQCPLVGEDPEESERLPVPKSWTAYLAKRQEIGDPVVHQQLQQDLVEHLWRSKGEV